MARTARASKKTQPTTRTYSKRTNSLSHPIDRRLAEMGKSRKWLAGQVHKTPQYIGQFCTRQRPLVPGRPLDEWLKSVLGVDWNYLILGSLVSARKGLTLVVNNQKARS